MNLESTHKLNEIRRIIILLRNDSTHLRNRIVRREKEYIHILSMKRTRSHFKEIFRSIYDTITVADLKLCTEDVILALDNYYSKVEQLRWYLSQTEDMPAMIEDKVIVTVKEISSLYDTLALYLNAELGVVEESIK